VYFIVVVIVILAAFKAAWDEYSPDLFALTCVCAVIGGWAAVMMSKMSAEAKASGKRIAPGDEGGYGCLFWIAFKAGGIAALLLLGAVYSRWF
jgi:hypothetical protein